MKGIALLIAMYLLFLLPLLVDMWPVENESVDMGPNWSGTRSSQRLEPHQILRMQ